MPLEGGVETRCLLPHVYHRSFHVRLVRANPRARTEQEEGTRDGEVYLVRFPRNTPSNHLCRCSLRTRQVHRRRLAQKVALARNS